MQDRYEYSLRVGTGGTGEYFAQMGNQTSAGNLTREQVRDLWTGLCATPIRELNRGSSSRCRDRNARMAVYRHLQESRAGCLLPIRGTKVLPPHPGT